MNRSSAHKKNGYFYIEHKKAMREIENMEIDATVNTPHVDLNPLVGELIFSGRSIPENATALYDPIYKWVQEYIKEPRPVTNLRLNLEYFNTASTIWLAKIIKSLSKIPNSDYLLLVHLYFNIEEFDDMEGEDLKEILTPVTDIVGDASVSVGIKVYGIEAKGSVLRENMILV
jgi:hypothetical protein